MRMAETRARELFGSARVARLATVDATGAPHLVPVVFVVAESRIYTAVDTKPKRHNALRRLANIRANPRVAVLADHYEENWTALWWVRADGTARIVNADEPEATVAVVGLTSRYSQYRDGPPPGPVIAIDVDYWSAWSAVA
jgi:PPOX class probable F420-dependent enzyme